MRRGGDGAVRPSDCLLNLAGPQAAGADPDPLHGALLHDAHALEIRVELPRPHIVGV